MTDLKKNGDEYDWIEAAVKLGKLVGMNPIRLRWKLRAWQDRMANRKRAMQSKAAAVTRKHKTCPKCRSLNSIDETRCSKCGAKLHSREFEIVARFLRHFDIGLSSETFLAAAFVVVYAVEVFRGHNAELFQWFGINVYDLVAMGGVAPADFAAGPLAPVDLAAYLQTHWYTLLTSVFLHAGIFHLVFNTYSLLYIAPFSRQVYNSGKVMSVFLVSGVAGSMASLFWRVEVIHSPWYVGIGASGGICGLIGLMLAWGHRDGTFSGTNIRNQMARWVAYILVYGYFLGADNVAHVGGLVAGGLLAYLLPADFNRPESNEWKVIAGISWLIVIGAVGWIIWLAFTVGPHL